MKIIAVIPAYNEEKTIGEVLERTRPFVDELIVVNDGSADRTQEIAMHRNAIVIVHTINRGLGAALASGFELAKRRGADVVITLDADGQHDPQEIHLFKTAIEQGAHVVIGSRLVNRSAMPLRRQIGNTLGNVITFLLFGVWVTDSQSGFRAFSREALHKIVLKTNRMEVSSEIIAEAKRNNFPIVEVPISTIYTHYSLSKGQNLVMGMKTMVKLILRRLI